MVYTLDTTIRHGENVACRTGSGLVLSKIIIKINKLTERERKNYKFYSKQKLIEIPTKIANSSLKKFHRVGIINKFFS